MDKKNFYFNEEEFQEMISEYQKTCVVKDKVIIEKDEILEKKIAKEINKIVAAIINRYSYYRWEEVDDMKQHAAFECYKAYLSFSPDKGTAFNFFSRIAKMCLFNYTTRKAKHRGHSDITEQKHISSRVESNFDFFLENLEDVLFRIISENYEGDMLEKYEKIAAIVLEYLRKNKNFGGKSDLYSFARGFGMRNSDVRNFILDIGKYKQDLFEGVK